MAPKQDQDYAHGCWLEALEEWITKAGEPADRAITLPCRVPLCLKQWDHVLGLQEPNKGPRIEIMLLDWYKPGDTLTVGSFILHDDDSEYCKKTKVPEALVKLVRKRALGRHAIVISGRDDKQGAAEIMFHMKEIPRFVP